MGEAQETFWGIHSEKDGKPVIRAWAKTEADANARLVEVKANDGSEPDDTYWVTPLSPRTVAMFKDSGFIPADA